MKCYCCNKMVDATIMWQSKPHDDGHVSIRIPLCLECSERVRQKAPVVPISRGTMQRKHL